MKNVILIFIVLIALYTLARNNIGILPDQIIWISSSDLFYKVFIPLLMLISSLFSFIKKNKINYVYLAFIVMFVDTINRLALGVNHIYLYQIYKDIPQPPPMPDTVTVVTNYWPSHIMLFIEIILIVLTLISLQAIRNNESNNS